ncbi:unnamed protein product [Blepharisma stoltei]|uniref:RING-type E3 ubiquitin transferase n=1 Tax=Blepharisma stoltei TaxID=1481888 RepID=A0AAU9IWW6_9CILI|nr:unnamed protein product [Blepharisma stoltei]
MGNCVGNSSRRRSLDHSSNSSRARNQNSLPQNTIVVISEQQNSAQPRANRAQLQNSPEANQVQIDSTIYKATAKLENYPENPSIYFLDFLFSTRRNCRITIYYFAKDIFDPIQNTYYFYVDPEKYPPPESHYFEPGDRQHFSHLSPIEIGRFSDDELDFKDKKTFPVIIEMTPESETMPQILTSYFKICKSEDQYSLTCLRQKISINGVIHELKDLYGYKSEGLECSICLTEKKEMVVLPCNHACLCAACAEHLKADAKKLCPICRGPIRQILKLSEVSA